MAEMAQAAVLTAKRQFDFREVPLPDIGPDDGLLRVEAAGLCGTDHEQYDGHFIGGPLGTLPVTPGHEILGFVDRLGANAAKRWGVKEGDRVIMETSIPCGECLACHDGRTIFCTANMGYGLRMGFDVAPHLWGGYATHLYLHPKARLHKAPHNIPTDAMSLFNPLANAVRWAGKRPNLRKGQSIVIEGPGQRGLLSVVVAREIGCERIIVTGTSADKERLALARKLGAHDTIVVDEEDPVERVIDITGGAKVDVVIDVSTGSTEPLLQAVEMVKKGGSVVVAGLKTHNALNNFFTDKLVFGEISMLGVLSSDWEDTEQAIELLSDHWQDLQPLATHGYSISEAEKAVQVLGREISDGPEPIHIYIDAMR